MKQLELSDLVLVSGGAPGGPISNPDLPPRAGEKEKKLTNADESYKASVLPVESEAPDEG